MATSTPKTAAAVRAANAAIGSLAGKNVLVVGGTQGIGAAAALRFASLGASVTVAGRTAAKGNAVVDRMRASSPPSSSPVFAFKPLDAYSMKACREFADAIAESEHVKANGLHALVMTAGHLHIGSRQETNEGIEKAFALNYLSKFVIATRLLPVLTRTQDARVVSVLGAGNAGSIDPNDIQLKSGFSFIKSAITTGILVDMMTKRLTRDHSNSLRGPSFYHTFPGFVNTDNVYNTGLPSFLAFPAKLALGFVGAKPETIAEEVVYIATSAEFGPLASGAMLHPGLKRMKSYPALMDESAIDKIWSESAKLVEGL
ncbi:hypothetical protein DFJ73DRAFT_812207 [Zopfochytrium polystomum]|nr:hypothetical protein DFJ73DRAFT_812207 [Zopfochytrium polystomum]